VHIRKVHLVWTPRMADRVDIVLFAPLLTAGAVLCLGWLLRHLQTLSGVSQPQSQAPNDFGCCPVYAISGMVVTLTFPLERQIYFQLVITFGVAWGIIFPSEHFPIR